MAEQVTTVQTTNVADLLERILDKGIVIVGDIKLNLIDVELITIKIRLLVASVDKAKSLGINWWEDDPFITSRRINAETSSE
ncbi:gas vesicle protein [Dictyobacter aurantiacus]|uniref:Uncharacterized protein n=1 Tax=Dictyobacter aurantiacus TaxID=1936993 RepID=A0A401ZGQ0_9CHLR|nr:gas vesicle protein [Dictyobacter aurantiacus]GCE06061.1 hypothetical protein KDAU_33900 [Dictyobacter aurantiacus]